MKKVGYVFDPFMTRHDNPYEYHPEAPERILEIYKEMLNRRLIHKMTAIKTREITREELLTVHSEKYLDKFYGIFLLEQRKECGSSSRAGRSIFEKNKTDKAIHSRLRQYDSVYANKHTLKCAELSAGSTVNLVQAMIDGEIDRGVAIVRPPGHHGCKNEANGFCFFNNIGLAAMTAINAGKKVAIVDFDIHHGQASEELVIGKKDLYYISIHRYDNGKFFPGTGKESKESNVLNIPLTGLTGTDEVYNEIFVDKVIPMLQTISPDIILVSAGFDAGENDPLGGYNVTPKGFRNMVKLMLTVSSNVCLVLEGGYNLETISKSMAECTEALLGKEEKK